MRKPGKVLIIIALCMIVFGVVLSTVAGVSLWTAGESWVPDSDIWPFKWFSIDVEWSGFPYRFR